MLKPGVSFQYLNPNFNYHNLNRGLEYQLKDYCKSEGINLYYYLYLLENNKYKISKFKLFALSGGIICLGVFIMTLFY